MSIHVGHSRVVRTIMGAATVVLLTAWSVTGSTGQSAVPSPSASVMLVPLASTEPELQLLWQQGGPTPARPGTAFPAIDHQGRIWVSSIWENQFWIFEPDGTFVEAWGMPGSGDGQLDFLYLGGEDAIGGVAFAPDGSFYTFDVGNLRIQRFDVDRNFVSSWGGFGRGEGQFSKPTALAVDPLGLVYVGDAARNDVQVFSPDGAYLRTIADGAGVGGFVYMAADRADGVYVNEGPMIRRYASDGTVRAVYDLTKYGEGTPSAVDAAGDLFVTTWASGDAPLSLLELDPAGAVLHQWPMPGEVVALDGDGAAIYETYWKWPYVRKYALPAE
jgi:hypothetical protein